MNINFSKFSFEPLLQTETVNPTAFLNSQISQNVHDQGILSYFLYLFITLYCILGNSSLCWAFASATMLRNSLLLFFKEYRGSLSSVEQTNVENTIKSDDFHRILWNQITMGPIPKRIKVTETAEQRVQHELNDIGGFLTRVIPLL